MQPIRNLRIGLTALIAAAVPVVWSAAVDLGMWPLTVVMVFVSASFWTVASHVLLAVRADGSALLLALGIGALSPILCSLFMPFLLMPVWPLLVLAGPAAALLAAPFAGPAVIVNSRELFVPVGAGMGLAAFSIARVARSDVRGTSEAACR